MAGDGPADYGHAYYVAPNPPFGAAFTYHLAESRTTRAERRKEAEQPKIETGEDTPFPAFETLEASGHAQESCEACHTVNGNGNPAEGGGWLATGDTRYHDVQCESCHGPGETHVSNPDASQPLAFVSVGLELDRGCGECH